MNKNDQVSTRWGRYSKVAVWQRRLGLCVLAPCFIAWPTGTVGRPPRKPAVIANVPIKSTSAWGEPERSVRLYRKIKKREKAANLLQTSRRPTSSWTFEDRFGVGWEFTQNTTCLFERIRDNKSACQKRRPGTDRVDMWGKQKFGESDRRSGWLHTRLTKYKI